MAIINNLLMEMARPDIYRINSFRILALPVTATQREISSQVKKLEMMQKLGAPAEMGSGLLPLNPPPGIDARNTALQRINDPESRFLDEIFWFWPLSDNCLEEDTALQSLRHLDYAGAISTWNQRENLENDKGISMHNLAILSHLLALDLENEQIGHQLSPEQYRLKREYWEAAFTRWRILLKHHGFREHLSQRIQSIDDPRLSKDILTQIMEGTPIALLSINANFALRAAQNNNGMEANTQITIMAKSGLGNQAVDEAMSRIVSPLRENVKIICTDLRRDVENDASAGDLVSRKIINQASPLLKTLDMLLPSGHPSLEMVHDQVALSVLQSHIDYANKTEDCSKSAEPLSWALNTAISPTARQRISENATILKNNQESNATFGTCWFCKKNRAEEGSTLIVPMHGQVERSWIVVATQVRYKKLQVPVPRCHSCLEAHSRSGSRKWLWGIVGSLAGLVGCIGLTSANNGGWGFATLVVLFLTGFIIGQITGSLPEGILGEDDMRNSPLVRKYLNEGWFIGEQP